MPGLLAPRFSFGVTAWAGSIFVYGGRNDRHCLKTMEIYHPDPGDKWIFAPARLHDARSEFGNVVYENQIYCFGGRGVSTIECYDYVNEHWRVVGRVGENTYSINCVLYPPLSFSDGPFIISSSHQPRGTDAHWRQWMNGFSVRPSILWKWRNARRSERNLCNCVKKPEKKISGLQRGLNPWPRDTGGMLYQLSYEATDVGSRSGV